MIRKISLITCVKNEEEYIAKMIDSVRDLPKEIIVVDTGSTDKTKEICKCYNNIKLIEMNREWYPEIVYDARKIAIKEATSEWILNLDADEEISLELRDEIVEFMEENKYDCLFLKRITFLKDKNHVYENCPRFFRNNIGFEFQLHGDTLKNSEKHSSIKYPEGSKIKNSKNFLFHFGWFALNKTKEIEKRSRYEEYLPFVKKETIPKIIHFFWTGPEFTYLDYMSVFSAWKFNKDFKIYMWYSGDVNIEWWKKLDAFCEKQDVSQLIKNNSPEDYSAVNKSNFIRYNKLFTIGGIYLDTDTLTLKSFLPLLNYSAFVGLESENIVNSGIIGSIPNHEIFFNCLKKSLTLTNTAWGCMGVDLFNSVIKEKKYNIEIISNEILNPILWKEWNKYFDENNKEIYNDVIKKATTIHYWSKMSRHIMKTIEPNYNKNNLIGNALKSILQEV